MVSISAERASLARVGGGLIRREQWSARRTYTDVRTVVEPARQVFIHVSVTNPNAYNSHAAHIRAIEAIGISRFPSTGVSYNRIIVFGVNTAYEAQPMGRRGAHTVNDFGHSTCRRWGSQCPGRGGSFNTAGHGTNLNYSARAYCYGALCEATATDSVVDTFARTIAVDMKAGLVRRDAEIHGHRCVSAKSCPCGMWARMHDLRARINHYLSSDLEDDMPAPKDWDADDRAAVREALFGENHYLRYVMMSDEKNLGWYLRSQQGNVRSGLKSALEEAADRSTPYGRQLGDAFRALHGPVIDLLRAQQPLLEAAAQGQPMTADQVQQVAQACAAAVPEDLAADVVDELHERTAPDA